ncbi:MAG: ribonuclease HI family protein [Armatimonadota bacterium]|nr:ribonuclease HI family protein [Armatimonadota bacterium]MCX7777500.1 ribonuclease HI family protein [Armatimonadota bacterium]MDW8025976.1 ribonuclease HI family protein [Armatimonadota bacterium]
MTARKVSAKELRIYADGASIGNPGPAGVGIVVEDEDGNVILTVSKPVGNVTGNAAEYLALIEALKLAMRYDAECIIVNLDSELVVKQVNGDYSVRSRELMPLHERVEKLRAKLGRCIIRHIPYVENRRAHNLARTAAQKLAVSLG